MPQKHTHKTYSDSTSATVHLYCAVENKQISANCLTETLIFFTVRFELFATWTFTEIVSPWWYNYSCHKYMKMVVSMICIFFSFFFHMNSLTSLSRLASKWILFGFIINSLLTSIEGCSPSFDGAYIILRIANRTEFRLCGLSSIWSPTNAFNS